MVMPLAPMGDEDNEYKKMLMAQLMNQQAEPVEQPNDNQMLAGFAQSMNKLGTLRGKSADSSDIGRFADTLDKTKQNNAMMAQNRLGKQQSILAELAKLRDNQTMKQNDLVAKNNATTEQRTFDKGQANTKYAREKELLGIKNANDLALAEEKAKNPRLKPPTEFQQKVAFQAARASDAGDLLSQMEKSGYDAGGYAKAGREVGWGKMSFRNEDDRKYDQAAKSMIASILRPETGAAVTAEEMAEYGPMYLPMPGDSPDVIAQKRQARDRDAGNLVKMGGAAYDPSMRKAFVYKKSAEPGTAYANDGKDEPPQQDLDSMSDEDLIALEEKLKAERNK